MLSRRRKFRSQTSDNMDKWKSRGGKSQRREEKKRQDQRRERVRRKKMQVREKVDKPRNTVFFQWFVARESRKVGSLKRRVQSHLARWEMKSCTPLWPTAHFEVKMNKTPLSVGPLLEVAMSKKCTREAHFEVKLRETPQCRTTFGSWHVEKVDTTVVRSTFRSQNLQHTHTPASEHSWKLRCKKCIVARSTLPNQNV